MSTDVLLPIVLFFALGIPIVILLWRIFDVGGELRREAQHSRAALDIARRADASLTELAAVVDELRRRKAGPEASEASLRAAADALRHYATEAAAVGKQADWPGGLGLKSELERAQRAVELVEHGRALMADGTMDRVSEGETSVKRGYLNLLHAREAIRAQAQAIAESRKAPHELDQRGRPRNR